MTRNLRGRPEHLVRFSAETTPDTRTTDRQKVPVYATVKEGTPIGWHDDLLACVLDVPEFKSPWVLANLECLPRKTRGRGWRGLREVTIHISDPRPYFGRADEDLPRRCGLRLQTLIRMARQSKHKEVLQIGEGLSSLIGQQMIRYSFGHRLIRVLRIAKQRASLSRSPAEEDLGDVIRELRGPSRSIFDSVSEYTARGSAFAPAFEMATTYGVEADLRRFWFGPNSDDLIFRGTLKHLADGHAFDAGNERLTRILDSRRRSMVKRLTRNTVSSILSHEPCDVPAFVDMNSRADRPIQAADSAAGLVRHVLGQEGPVGPFRRWGRCTTTAVGFPKTTSSQCFGSGLVSRGDSPRIPEPSRSRMGLRQRHLHRPPKNPRREPQHRPVESPLNSGWAPIRRNKPCGAVRSSLLTCKPVLAYDEASTCKRTLALD